MVMIYDGEKPKKRGKIVSCKLSQKQNMSVCSPHPWQLQEEATNNCFPGQTI
jgi:hypothetical protein